MSPVWQNSTAPSDAIAPEFYKIIASHDSLSAHLRKISQQKIRHHVHFDNWGNPLKEEMSQLPAENQYWLREISWNFAKEIWVVGRVIIPESTIKNLPQLMHVGNTSLGDLLFANDQTTRAHLQYAELSANHPYTQLANKIANTNSSLLWARRSLLNFHQHPLLVCEVFLPTFLHYMLNA